MAAAGSQRRQVESVYDISHRVLPSIVRALVGEITEDMRAIAFAVDWPARLIEIRVYTQGEASDETKEDFDASAITQIVADFSFPEKGDPMVTFSFQRCDEPSLIPNWGSFVFARKGARFQQPAPTVE
jgi:hypothetical protein